MEIPRLQIALTEAYIGVFILAKELYQGVLLLGKSGTGKTTTLARLWYQACFYKFSKILIDPSGFSAVDAYSMIKGRVHYFSADNPLSFNPMRLPYSPTTICDIIAESINQLIKMTTPNDYLTAKMRVILDDAIKYCLSKDGLKSLVHVRDHIINTGNKGDAQTRDGIIQRLNFILTDDMIPVLCGDNPIEWGELIQNKESLILNCSRMPKEKMIFIGNIVSQGIKGYFRFQQPRRYQPILMLIDECQHFVNSNFFDLLKEGRKYKLSCVLSTQDRSMIAPALWQTMMNVGSIIAYRLGYQEAASVGREMNLTAQTLQNLEQYHVAYMTPSRRGMGKALRPPTFKKIPIHTKPKIMKKKSEWFQIESYQPSNDSEHTRAVFADAQRQGAEIPLSSKKADS